MKDKALTTLTFLLLLLSTTLFYSCDKEGNPLPDDKYVEITYNGETFIQQGKLFSFNPRQGLDFEYYYYDLPQYAKGVRFITLNASMNKKGSKDRAEHTIYIKIPVGDEILLNHEYVIKSIPGKQIVNKGDEYYSTYESDGLSFIRYNQYLNFSQYIFGDGKVYFTKITKKENGAEDIEGTFEFSIPSFAKNDGFDVVKGKFKLHLKKI
ncbi:hypothetical protein CHU00_18790 [Sphingobacterium cellulitidis]|uniref:hypothetical protein n=1 Tax=Sphingobacterium cellulitidis TaxID=1768011 RepID=UPI000B93E107|nr:hypothetical protein [Sphingobacterium cellulitidis]OYD44072.1 hypothetical protein CHU00_18790 [Sphingobacterium cellulitidis]